MTFSENWLEDQYESTKYKRNKNMNNVATKVENGDWCCNLSLIMQSILICQVKNKTPIKQSWWCSLMAITDCNWFNIIK